MTIKILNLLQKIFLFLPFAFILACHPTGQIDFNSKDAFFKSLERPEIKKNEKSIFKNDSLEKNAKKINEKKLKKIKPNVKTKDIKKIETNLKKIKREIPFDLKNYINKKENDLIKIFGKPNMLIKHGKILNYQYHLKNCFIDLFFTNKNKNIVLSHFEFRPTKIKSILNEKVCIKEIISLKNINNKIH